MTELIKLADFLEGNLNSPYLTDSLTATFFVNPGSEDLHGSNNLPPRAETVVASSLKLKQRDQFFSLDLIS